jgi:hypothetical protein
MTPVGDVVDLTRAGLEPADGVIFISAHLQKPRITIGINLPNCNQCGIGLEPPSHRYCRDLPPAARGVARASEAGGEAGAIIIGQSV